MSNAITDILNDHFFGFVEPGLSDEQCQELFAEALQALYEAVKGCVPRGFGDRVEGSGTAAASMRGYNECRDEVL